MLKVWDLQVDGLPPPEPESETAEAFRAARASPPMPVPALDDINSALVPPPPSSSHSVIARGENAFRAWVNATARNEQVRDKGEILGRARRALNAARSVAQP